MAEGSWRPRIGQFGWPGCGSTASVLRILWAPPSTTDPGRLLLEQVCFDFAQRRTDLVFLTVMVSTLALTCAGVHRSLGVHLSFVRWRARLRLFLHSCVCASRGQRCACVCQAPVLAAVGKTDAFCACRSTTLDTWTEDQLKVHPSPGCLQSWQCFFLVGNSFTSSFTSLCLIDITVAEFLGR